MTDKEIRILRETRWPSVLYYLYLHFSALVGLYLAVFQAKWTTIFYSNYSYFYLFISLINIVSILNSIFLIIFIAICLIHVSVLGLTVGAHRLWAHISFKAATILRVFLAFSQTLICQVYANHQTFGV